ncbi:STAS domain-containing protein [Actinomadura geliboluensis]|nr:STAS domain-containing protein [Actinomadura geliboluensis]CNF13960.1 Putative anti-sigma factor antagonist TM_1442 [Mycobacterium tuberculosis]
MTVTLDASPPGPQLSVEMVPAGPWLMVELRGELDRFTVAALLDRAGALIAHEVPPRVALELSQVSFCDSSGLNAFVRLWKSAGAAGGELVLLRPQSRLAASLAQTAIDSRIRVLETLPA